MAINRRGFLRNGLAGALGLSFRAAVTGLPASFLLSRTAHAVNEAARFTLLAGSASGESMNCCSPGTFARPGDTESAANLVEHPTAAQTGGVTRTINGVALTGADLAEGMDIRLGSNVVRGARAFRALDPEFRNGLVAFWHHSRTNGHNEYWEVIKAHGALKGASGSGQEQLPSAIAQEMAERLNTTLNTPFILNGGNYRFAGAPLSQVGARSVKDLMNNTSVVRAVDGDEFSTLYNAAIDEIYADVKANGTPAQRRFLDQHASSRVEAADLGDQLGSLLDGINGNGQREQFLTAAALFMVRLAPVVVVKHDFSGDNHGDTTLQGEVRRTFGALESMQSYWDVLGTYNLRDRVVFANMNVFGRTSGRNSRGGRDHHGAMTCGYIHATNLNGGIVGGLREGGRGTRAVVSDAINSSTGGTENPDITTRNTLGAFTKTVMAAAGVSEARRDVRMPNDLTVTSIFNT